MDDRLNKIEKKLDNIQKGINEIAVEHSVKIAKMETTQRGFITIITAVMAGCITTIVNLFK